MIRYPDGRLEGTPEELRAYEGWSTSQQKRISWVKHLQLDASEPRPNCPCCGSLMREKKDYPTPGKKQWRCRKETKHCNGGSDCNCSREEKQDQKVGPDYNGFIEQIRSVAHDKTA